LIFSFQFLGELSTLKFVSWIYRLESCHYLNSNLSCSLDLTKNISDTTIVFRYMRFLDMKPIRILFMCTHCDSLLIQVICDGHSTKHRLRFRFDTWIVYSQAFHSNDRVSTFGFSEILKYYMENQQQSASGSEKLWQFRGFKLQPCSCNFTGNKNCWSPCFYMI
jgi:hypothetical protein